MSRSGRSPGEGNGNSLQYSCLENSMDRGAWRATVQGITKSWTQLSDQAHQGLVSASYLEKSEGLRLNGDDCKKKKKTVDEAALPQVRGGSVCIFPQDIER